MGHFVEIRSEAISRSEESDWAPGDWERSPPLMAEERKEAVGSWDDENQVRL